MKILVVNTSQGLVPHGDSDYEEKSRLTLGKPYIAEIREPRNYEFLKKYFSLISAAWDISQPKTREFFRQSKESFRKSMEMAAGFYEPIYSVMRKEWIEMPKSISFSKMEESEFKELYDRVFDILLSLPLRHITLDEFNKYLSNY